MQACSCWSGNSHRIRDQLSPWADNCSSRYVGKFFAVVAIENSVGIICGCIPGCKPLLAKLAPLVFGSTNATSGTQSNSGYRRRTIIANQTFSFQTLGGGDGTSTKEEKQVVDGDGSLSPSQCHGERRKSTVANESVQTRSVNDAVSIESQDWILMEENVVTRSIKSEISQV